MALSLARSMIAAMTSLPSDDVVPPRSLLLPFPAASNPVPVFPIYERLTEELLAQLRQAGGWHLVLGEGGRAEATTHGEGLLVHIHDGGTIWYAVQLSCLPLPLEAGRNYSVRFEARADHAQPMVLDIAQIGTWYSYSPRVTFQITESWQEFTTTLAMGAAASEPNARFEFNLGHAGPNRVQFRRASVAELSARPAA